jgi:hypothetical protein
MHTHEKIGLTLMAAAEGARGAKEIYEHVRRIRRKHSNSTKPVPRHRRHFNWALCAVICVGAIIPAFFYSGEAFS